MLGQGLGLGGKGVPAMAQTRPFSSVRLQGVVLSAVVAPSVRALQSPVAERPLGHPFVTVDGGAEDL